MQGTQNQIKSSSHSIMPFQNDSGNKDETSDLHDLQAMASSAKKRRSQRLSSQMDAQDSLLQSSAALDAVVLPDPNKEQNVSIVDVATAKAAANGTDVVAEVAMAAAPVAVMEEKKSSGKGLYVGLALAAAAAAGAFFMLGQKDTPSESTATAPAAVSAAAPAASDPSTAPEAPPVPAIVDDESENSEMAALADDEAASETEDTEPAAVSDTQEDTDAEPAASEKVAKVKSEKPKADLEKTDKEKADKPKVVAAANEKNTKSDEGKEEKPKKEEKPEPKLDSNASMDDILSSVTGGIDKPIAKKEEADTPSRTTLSRGDVAKAMKKITPSAKACYKVEEFSGMVKIKYSVDPDGSVTKAAASAPHASSKTGQCVVDAVKKASFPPFNGATMSFTFPFLLAP